MPRPNSSDASTTSTSWLSRFVEGVHAVEPVAGHVRHERLPDGRTTLVFRVTAGGKGDVAVAGPRTRALFKQATGVARAMTLQFKPGWSTSLLGVAASALADRIVPLEDLWGRAGGDLFVELAAARSAPEVFDRLSRALALRAQQTSEPASARLARRAVRLLEGGEARVEHAADEARGRRRALRRRREGDREAIREHLPEWRSPPVTPGESLPGRLADGTKP
ncbi:MAG TPA: DUF6597 domain-containing transcriptional factor [Polyangiaceae bacterium]|nr:DUF6597 domain-containing transcriptional factor [Polyangiaceae bacterium]